MTIDPQNPKHIIAAQGKVIVRKADGAILGTEVYLGKTYYISGKRVTPPHVDVVSDFKEIVPPTDSVEE